MKKIVLTGATSFLGLALIEECIAHDTHVTAIVRKDSHKLRYLQENSLISLLFADMDDYLVTPVKESDYDAFFHFAWARTSDRDRTNVHMQCRNINNTLNAVHLAQRMGCRKFIGSGSQAEFGRVSNIIANDYTGDPDDAYGVAKLAAGRLAGLLCEQIGMSFIWSRVFSVYGEHDDPKTMIMYTIDRLLRGQIPELTKCEQMWDYLHVSDAAKAFYLLGQKGKSQSRYNIGSGVHYPLSHYVSLLRNAIDPLLPIGFGAREYSHNQVMFLCADISLLKNDTNFSPKISFENGIERTISWYQKNYGNIGHIGM